MKHIIIGTAGHVDHGKTEIVRALTGRETDRLAEERERGISIVLGFAPVDLGGGLTAGIVDVPGHERFVKNMVSGATGVDLALIVVAADESVMPQTVEHFEVLRLLGIDSAVIAVTKTDLVDAETAGVVESEILDLLEGTPLESAPIVRTSSVTGEGIEELRTLLRETAGKTAASREREYFRLPVDRVFTRSGIGTIVTGTAWSGSVSKGDELVVEPGGWKVRVRDVHSFDHTMETGEAGMRTALALHGVKPGDLAPGLQVMTPGVSSETMMMDVTVEMSRIEGSRLENRQRVRFHHAARETLARAVLLDREELERGGAGLVQLRFEKPVLAIGGDRFIIRQYSPMRVIGGGIVLDPAAAKSGRFDGERIALLGKLGSSDREEALRALVERAGTAGFDPAEAVRYGIGEAVAESAARAGGPGMESIGGRLFSARTVNECADRVKALLEEAVRKDPLVWGMDKEMLRSAAGLGAGPLFEHILESGAAGGVLFMRDGKVRAGSGELELKAEDRDSISRIGRMIEEAGMRFLTRRDLEHAGFGGRELTRYLHIMQAEGSVQRIAEDSFVHPAAMAAMKEELARMLAGGGTMSVGDFKERFGLSRKYAVPILEFLDRERITVRSGDERKAGPSLEGQV